MADLSPSQIVQKVTTEEDRTQGLRERMEADWSLYRLDPFVERDDDGKPMAKGYAVYTSNEPQYYADKLISLLTSASLIIRIPQSGKARENREIDGLKEKFIIGAFKAADDLLIERALPVVQEQLAGFVTLRGYVPTRALLVKDKDTEETYVDITPWDPLHTTWEVGRRGLLWACYKRFMTLDQIEEEYDVRLDRSEDSSDSDGVEVYDYYNAEQNMVVAHDEFLKKPTKHGAVRVPVAFGITGALPPIQTSKFDESINFDWMNDYGESVFKANRAIYENNNLTKSILLELVRRSRDQPLLTYSQDGMKEIENDPRASGAEIPLRMGQEDVRPLGLMEAARETAGFMAGVSGELQRGGLPYTVYGELGLAISGFAISLLNQNVLTQLTPRVATLNRVYKQIGFLIIDQYSTGAFGPFEVNGQTRDRQYFSETISPEVVQAGGDPTFALISKLPQDDQAKMAQAQIAREGAVPLLHDRAILDEILAIQDSDQMIDGVKTQMAERGAPMAVMYELMMAAAREGKTQLAQIYLQEMIVLFQGRLQALTAQGMPPGGSANGAAGPTFAPEVLPNAMQGVPPPAPNPQFGPNVPPGQPRPGAQAALVGPRGERLL